MKFEINSSKLDQVIFKYLDNKKFIIKETDDNYYFLDNEGDRYARIRIRKSDMLCYIYYDLFEEIESFFSLEFQMVKSVLTKYIENILNIRVLDFNHRSGRTSRAVENTPNIELIDTVRTIYNTPRLVVNT